MPYKRGKTFDVKLDEDDKLLLETLAKRHKLPQKFIVGHLIALCDKYNLMAGDWQDRLEGEDQARQRYTKLDNACGNMTFAKEDYICVRAVLGKPPSIKKLSDTIEEALDICAICEEDTRKKLDRDLTLERVKELENKLKVRNSEKFKVPVCRYDGFLSADGLSFEGCRLYRGKTLSIEKFCKVRMNGRSCDGYVERTIAVGDGETPDPELMK